MPPSIGGGDSADAAPPEGTLDNSVEVEAQSAPGQIQSLPAGFSTPVLILVAALALAAMRRRLA
jgi:hypothetical protein